MKTNYPSLVAACKDYFGLAPEQNAMQFLQEFKQLTEQDRKDLIGYFAEVGITVNT